MSNTEFLLLAGTIIVLAIVVGYYERQLNNLKDENIRLKSVVHPSTRGIDWDSEPFTKHTALPVRNLNKDRSLSGKARRRQRKALAALSRSAHERSLINASICNQLKLDQLDALQDDIDQADQADNVDRYFGETPIAEQLVTTGND